MFLRVESPDWRLTLLVDAVANRDRRLRRPRVWHRSDLVTGEGPLRSWELAMHWEVAIHDEHLLFAWHVRYVQVYLSMRLSRPRRPTSQLQGAEDSVFSLMAEEDDDAHGFFLANIAKHAASAIRCLQGHLVPSLPNS